MKNQDSSTTRPFLVAEVSSNHSQSRRRALAFIEETARLGFDAVKFQQFKINELFSPSALAANPNLLERIDWELPETLNAELSGVARSHGLEYQSTPFYRSAVDALEPHVDRFKLASYQVLWHDLLRLVAETGKPVILATGMATLDEVRAAVDVLQGNGCGELTLLHCVSLYPTPPEEANLRAIETMRGEFGLPIGWSDHTRSIDVVERAVRRFGANLVELHLDLDGEGNEYSSGHCWLPVEARQLVERLREEREIAVSAPCDGDGRKLPRAAEAHERQWRTDPTDGLRPLISTRLHEGLDVHLDPDHSRLSEVSTSVVDRVEAGDSGLSGEQAA